MEEARTAGQGAESAGTNWTLSEKHEVFRGKTWRYGAEGGTRTPTSRLTRPSTVRVCQFRHFGPNCQITIASQLFRW